MSQITMKFEGESDYGGFFLQDASIDTGIIREDFHARNPHIAFEKERWIYTVNRGIVFDTYTLTSNKNDQLCIEINLLDNPPVDNDFNDAKIVVETSLEITSDSLALTALPDGEQYPFGVFPIKKGTYRLRIHCRSVDSDPYGEYEDKNYEEENQDPWGWGIELRIYIWADELLEQRTLYEVK